MCVLTALFLKTCGINFPSTVLTFSCTFVIMFLSVTTEWNKLDIECILAQKKYCYVFYVICYCCLLYSMLCVTQWQVTRRANQVFHNRTKLALLQTFPYIYICFFIYITFMMLLNMKLYMLVV